MYNCGMKSFKRKIYEKLKEWKANHAGKTALLLEGARRVGKSTVVEEFADSKTVNVAYHANNPEAGLMQNIDVRKFKLFMADTGLFVTQPLAPLR